MAFTIKERWESRSGNDGDNPSRKLLYTLVTDAANFATDDPFTALAGASPTTFGGLPRRTLEVVPIGPYSYGGTVTYGRAGRLGADAPGPDVGDEEFSFRGSTESKHITVGREHIASLPSSPSNPFQGAIGVTADDVQGTDILVPVFGFSITKWFDATDVDQTFILNLRNKLAKVNSDSWRGHAAGEVLFVQVTGGPVNGPNSDIYELTFDFASSANLSSVAVGDLGTLNVKGWEHLWVRFKDDVNTNKFVQVPESAHVERVYDTTAFSGIPISSS